MVKEQLRHYNAHDVDNFVAVFDDEVEIYVLGESTPYMVGREAMRVRYGERFKTPDLHAEVTNRMVKGQVVIDYEEVTGLKENETVIAIAIYEIEGQYIKKVHFVR